MGFTKDLWTRPEEQPDGKIKRVPNARWGKGKRWLACWTDPDGNERTRAFQNKTPADLHWQKQAVDVERGDYHDPKAGRKLFGELANAWLPTLDVDPSTMIGYERVMRLHILPKFKKRPVGAIQPSEVNAFLAKLGETHEPGTRIKALHLIQGVLDLAEADGLVKKNVARSKVITKIKRTSERVMAWSDERVFALIDAHPPEFRLFPIIAASCGLRGGELFGLAAEDIDFDERVIHVRRQLKRLGTKFVFALPKNDQERDVPLSDWTAQNIRLHTAKYKPSPCSLPWETMTGPLRAYNTLFRWRDGGFVKERSFSEEIWKPALHAAGVIGPPVPNSRKQLRYVTTRKEGPHQLRHYYASVTLADGVNVKELSEYLGHHDPGFTLRLYAHMLPDSHDRARQAIDRRMFRPRVVNS